MTKEKKRTHKKRLHGILEMPGLLVTPSEGGLDVSVPKDLLLDGDPQAARCPRCEILGTALSQCEQTNIGHSLIYLLNLLV